jgi:hypothetical protein
MTDIIVEIMVAVLSFLALATKEVKRGRICMSAQRIFIIHHRYRLTLDQQNISRS